MGNAADLDFRKNCTLHCKQLERKGKNPFYHCFSDGRKMKPGERLRLTFRAWLLDTTVGRGFRGCPLHDNDLTRESRRLRIEKREQRRKRSAAERAERKWARAADAVRAPLSVQDAGSTYVGVGSSPARSMHSVGSPLRSRNRMQQAQLDAQAQWEEVRLQAEAQAKAQAQAQRATGRAVRLAQLRDYTCCYLHDAHAWLPCSLHCLGPHGLVRASPTARRSYNALRLQALVPVPMHSRCLRRLGAFMVAR